jgi:glutamate 5-kinase
MGLWDQFFTPLRQPIAQILLTRSDIADVGVIVNFLIESER